jgi:multidrug efflux pump subunit AcrA (membrane-fusion protein)
VLKKIHVALLFLLVFTLSACSSGAGGGPTPTPLPAVVSYEKAVFTVERGPILSEVELRGEVVPARQDELFFRAEGFVTRVAVKSGDLVKQGDVLAEMQVDDLLNQLQQAEIDLDVAQANLAKETVQRQADIERARAEVIIWEKRVALAMLDLENKYGDELLRAQLNLDITEQNLVMAEQSLKLLTEDDSAYTEQAVKRSELAVERLRALLSERQIVAPYDCIIIRASARPGQQYDAFLPAFTVGDPAELVIRSPKSIELSSSISSDSEVRMKVSQEAEESWPVSVLPNFLPVSAEEEENDIFSQGGGRQEYFYFSLPEGIDPELVPVGRSVNLTLVLGRKEDALLLPPAAIREYRGLHFVIVQDGDLRRRVEVNEIGLKGEEKWEVVGDLTEGDQVLGP